MELPTKAWAPPPNGVTVRGSVLRPFFWAALLFYTGFGLIMYFVNFVVRDGTPWSVMIVIDAFSLVAFTYFAWLTQSLQAYSITLTDEGVYLTYRSPIPGRAGPTALVEWKYLREPFAHAGFVTIKTNQASTWLNLSYEQARAVLMDERCPLKGNVPSSVAQRIEGLS